MNALFQAVRQDIKAAIMSYQKDDFDEMNIYANRAMANAILGNNKKLILPGFFLKDVASIYGSLKIRKKPTAFSTAKAVGDSYIKSLNTNISDQNFDENELWKEFHKFYMDLRKFLMSEFEEKAYTENLDFTRYAFKWLIEYLKNNKEVLSDPNNFLLRGLLNEMERIIRVHTSDLSGTYALSLIRALDRFYSYFRIIHRTEEGGINREKLETIVFPYVDKIEALLSGAETRISEGMNVLWDLTKGWREFFIQYMEPRLPPVTIERGIQIPEEAKKKLTEGITKALERDVEIKE